MSISFAKVKRRKSSYDFTDWNFGELELTSEIMKKYATEVANVVLDDVIFNQENRPYLYIPLLMHEEDSPDDICLSVHIDDDVDTILQFSYQEMIEDIVEDLTSFDGCYDEKEEVRIIKLRDHLVKMIKILDKPIRKLDMDAPVFEDADEFIEAQER